MSKIVLALMLVLLNPLLDDTSMNMACAGIELVPDHDQGMIVRSPAVFVRPGFYFRPFPTRCMRGQCHAVWTRHFENKNGKIAKLYTIFSMIPIERIGQYNTRRKHGI
ncbi:hypothetical protein [Janthinobacterium svalbardensis]|uniref:hypothetical protein n=1 Tax=Janthinobacterium svalbardensis TaxID=368607 RepID=UPI002FCD8B82